MKSISLGPNFFLYSMIEGFRESCKSTSASHKCGSEFQLVSKGKNSLDNIFA
jgi:hypothetical protein